MLAIIVPLSAAFIYWGTPLGNNSGPGSVPVNNIATAAGTDITVEDYQQALLAERQRQSQFGQQVTLEQLIQSGAARNVLQNLIDRELLRAAADSTGYTFDRKLLADRLKKDPYFQNEDGSFNAERWNELVDNGVNGGWEQQYNRIASDLRYSLYVQSVLASARVIEPEVRDQFKEGYELQNTRITVKQAAIEPKITPTDEEIRARYDEDPSLYEKPEERTIEFVSWSLQPPMPAEAATIVKRARDGEPFETLVEEFSQGPFKDAGGDLGWITRTLTTPQHQLVLFDMEVGGVSDPISGPGGYYIFKLEEKRESEVTGALDVRARQIMLAPTLDEATSNAINAEAEAVADKVAAGATFSDLDIELDPLMAGPISIETRTAENIPDEDYFAVRGAVLPLAAGEYTGVVKGANTLYVARVADLKPAEPRPFEEVRDEVEKDVISLKRRSPDYVAERTKLANEIAEKAKSFDDIRAQYPDLPLEVKTLPEFSAMDYDFQSGPPWQAGNVIQAVADAQLGELVGPVNDFLGNPHFVELIARTTPEEGAWETEWETQKQGVIEQQQFAMQQERLEDYLMYLRTQGDWTLDESIFAQLMAVEAPEPVEKPATQDPIEMPPMEIELSDTPAVESTDAAEAETVEEATPEAVEETTEAIVEEPAAEPVVEEASDPAPASPGT